MSQEIFEKALEFLFPAEGGYTNNKYDRGGATNMGITQNVYNVYRKKQGLPTKNVIKITTKEARDIYYNDYWKKSGADNITDPNLAVALFDTAVLHGPNTAKKFLVQSNGNLEHFLDIRKNSYDLIIANNPSQKIFYNGWNNRVENLKKAIRNGTFQTNTELPIKFFDLGIEMNVDTDGNEFFTPKQIENMSLEEFQENEEAIMQQLKNGQIQPHQKTQNYQNYKQFNMIYTREDIQKMSNSEYANNEKAIMQQLNKIGIPSKKELPNGIKTYTDSKNTTQHNYTSSGDGKWVTINGNHVLMEK